MTPEHSKSLNADFLNSINTELPEIQTNSIRRYYGIHPIYTYNNVEANKEDERVSCGQAAIATLFDYYHVSPYPLIAGSMSPRAVDGKKHYSNKLVEYVMKDYPPANILSFRFTTREIILRAARDRGIRADEGYAGVGGNGRKEQKQLINWINKYKRPVLVLIDLHDLSKKSKIMGSYPNWYALHWAFVYGYTKTHVKIASWTRVFSVPWNAFMDGWHCKGLPYPNNYYAIFTYK